MHYGQMRERRPDDPAHMHLLLQHRNDPGQDLCLLQGRLFVLITPDILSDCVIHHRRHLLDLSVQAKIFALE